LLADWNKKKLIDRFVQSVAYHGPSLITLTKQQQGEGEDSPMSFLYPSTEGNMGTNYFRNKLQVSVSIGLNIIHKVSPKVLDWNL